MPKLKFCNLIAEGNCEDVLINDRYPVGTFLRNKGINFLTNNRLTVVTLPIAKSFIHENKSTTRIA